MGLRKKILLVSQVFPPDPAAVARVMGDVGSELAARGNDVVALTSDHGYDDPTVKYPSRSDYDGVKVRRLPFCSFGKQSIAYRLLGGMSFTLQATFRALLLPGLDTVVVSTSPPMASFVGLVIGTLRRVRVVYWPMDLNPDQALALGWAREGSLSVRVMEWLNRAILRKADVVIALDHTMADRLERKVPVADRLVIVPPWPEEDDVREVPPHENPFRALHGLDGKRVVMYSGTLGLANPVNTLLDAAEQFEDQPDLVFLFVGGGAGMSEIRSRNRPNVRWLPYQPFDQLRYSLSAGDVHVVSLGDAMAGIVHPCKVYGAMARGRPILYLGPPASHVTEMMAEADFGWQVRHGDVAGAVAVIRTILEAEPASLNRLGAHGQALIEGKRTRRISCGRVCDAIEAAQRVAASRAEQRTGVQAA
ncbi:MAG TPA: glycosyltransferase family 4 protein [Gemmatimonadaceae bacterium]